MARIKDKVVTAESLSALHKYNENTYITKSNPTANGITFNGDASFFGDVSADSLTIGSDIKLFFENGYLKIISLRDPISELNGVVLLSSEGIILKDSNELYLTSKESE